ncbi:MAG: hypothetical protein KC621_22635 [Myxococcales bacterium]|nr:hypothetical protein [Myxococcales bacterium]
MTITDLYALIAANPGPVLLLGAFWPGLIAVVSAGLRFAGAAQISQQVANFGIAVGAVAVTTLGLGLAYGISHGADPIASVPFPLLIVPPWLLVAGVVTEHLIHPGKQESLRRPVRVLLQTLAVVVVLVAIFSVLRIHMLVFTGMLGFLGFVAVLVVLAWWMIRRMV